jgi:DNA polymerase-3 subunit epsilon
VYYFKNKKGKIIYVGKAINIKKRVLSHFYDRTDKEVRMCRETTDIDFERSGNEIVALLMESAAIKRHYPIYNHAQKRRVQQYGIFSYEDRKGIMHLAFNRLKLVSMPLLVLNSTTDCRLYIEQLCSEFGLCPKYCHLQEQVKSCSHYRLTSCQGICKDIESPRSYNKKVLQAISYITVKKGNYLIKETGRDRNEDAFILIKDGVYSGYGFIPKDLSIGSVQDIEAFVKPQPGSLEAERLVNSYVLKLGNKEKMLFPEALSIN